MTDVPGPGTYRPKNDLSGEGNYVLSQNVSSGKRMMLKSQRDSFVDEDHKRKKNPGPGTYRSPSDFGQYDEFPENSSWLMGKSLAKSKFMK